MSKPKRTSISKRDLRILLFWADYGMGRAYGGSSGKRLMEILNRHYPYGGSGRPRWGRYMEST